MPPETRLALDFGQSGNSRAFLGRGWSHQEPRIVWAVEGESELRLPGLAPADLAVEAVVMPFVEKPRVPRQRLVLLWNGREVGAGELAAPGQTTLRFRVPREAVSPEANAVLLVHPDAEAPARIGSSGDPRRLAFGFFSLTITPEEGQAEAPAAAPQLAAPSPARTDAQTRPILLVHGDGPAREVWRILRQLPRLRAHFEPRWVTDGGGESADSLPPEARARVRVYWRQNWLNATAPTQGIEAELPALELCQRFPRPSLDLLWPFAGEDPRRVPEPPAYPGGRYFYTDRVAARLAGVDLPDDELFALYLRETAREMPDLERRLEEHVERWRAQDAAADVRMADFVLGWFRARRLYHAWLAPAGQPLAALAEKLLAACTLLPEDAREALRRDVRDLTRTYIGMFHEQVPIHPVVAEAYGLVWWRPDMTYRHHFNKWTMKQYLVNYMRWEPWTP